PAPSGAPCSDDVAPPGLRPWQRGRGGLGHVRVLYDRMPPARPRCTWRARPGWRVGALGDRVSLLLGVRDDVRLPRGERGGRSGLALVQGLEHVALLVEHVVLERAPLVALVVGRRLEEDILVDLLASEEGVLL